MRIVIMGCGRVGARLASMLDQEGHAVTVVDVNPQSFARLPPTFSGTSLVGDGTNEDVLRAAGIAEAHVFVAVTQGDNRNIMASQIAKEVFRVPQAITRIYDPMRQEMYSELGLLAFSPTTVVTRMIHDAIGVAERV